MLFLITACSQSPGTPPEVSLTPDRTSVEYEGNVVLSWQARGTDYCIASGDWSGNVKRSGSKTLGPLTRDSLYMLDCFDKGEKISSSVSVSVGQPQIPVIRLSASPLSIPFDGTTTLSWSSEHVMDCQASGAWSGPKPAAGSEQVTGLSSDSEFILTCTGPRREVSDSVRVDVYEQGIIVPLVELNATPARVSYDGSTVITWNSSNADICRASGDWSGSKNRSGSETVRQLKSDSRFIMTCSMAGDRGVAGVNAIDVAVEAPPQPVVTLTATPPRVVANGSTTLRWSSSNADSCIATGDWSGTRRAAGTQTIRSLQGGATFTLRCAGIGGSGSNSVSVGLIDQPATSE